MTPKITIFLLVITTAFFIVIIRLVRKNVLPPSSTLLWVFVGLVMLSIPLFKGFYHYIAFDILGFSDATHIVYILNIGFLMLYSVYITIKLKKSSDRIQILISQLAIVEAETDRRLTILEDISKTAK